MDTTMNKPGLKEMFFQEIMAYRPALMRALVGILGEVEAKSVLRRLLEMEASGGFVDDPKPMRELGAFFVGEAEDLGFYVLMTFEKDIELQVRDSGRIEPPGLTVETRPVFLYWDEAIAHCASRLAAYELPKYFVPWLHEFSHFLCYCHQERPLMAAISMLTSALNNRGYPIGSLRDLDHIREGEKDSPVWQMARTLVQLVAVNEAMAVWWEDRLLRGMEFDVGDYIDSRRANNPYIAQLEAGGEKASLNYISNWHDLRYYREPFTRTFLESFGKIEVDRWRFLDMKRARGNKGVSP